MTLNWNTFGSLQYTISANSNSVKTQNIEDIPSPALVQSELPVSRDRS